MIVHPQLASLLARFRHANAIAILDGPFPSYPDVETIELILTRGVPTIPQVVDVILAEHEVSSVVMAHEFKQHVDATTQADYLAHLGDLPVEWIPHVDFKKQVGTCLGIVHTGDAVPYSNVILRWG
ncbi:MAG: RbsD/FucU domain-containing protein [Candidatus Nanopelagicales bacterium]